MSYNTGTILDALPPEPWYRRRKRPATALDLAVADLQESQRDLLEHKRKAEYHAAMQAMLTKRITRLQADIRRLSAENRNLGLPVPADLKGNEDEGPL